MNENLSPLEKFFKETGTVVRTPNFMPNSTPNLRGFEVVSEYKDKGIKLPVRATKTSAGYDFEAAEDITIPALAIDVWTVGGLLDEAAIHTMVDDGNNSELLARYHEKLEELNIDNTKPRMVKTGIKAYMQPGEYLALHARSSLCKKGIILANGVGVVDQDYYNNPSNEGHVMFPLLNIGIKDVVIKKGERIGQGIFTPFLQAYNDNAQGSRDGGFGSTGE